MTVKPSSQAMLFLAIDSADTATLRTLMKSLCESSPECYRQVTQRLLVGLSTQDPSTSTQSSTSSSLWKHPRPSPETVDKGSDDVDQQSSKKRQKMTEASSKTTSAINHLTQPVQVIISYDICATCHKKFDPKMNQEDSCQIHVGDLEVDEEYFPDDDDIQAGVWIDVNTDWRVKSVPEGFTWSCCEEDADGLPCVLQKHIAMK